MARILRCTSVKEPDEPRPSGRATSVCREVVILGGRFKLIAVPVPTLHALPREEFEIRSWGRALDQFVYDLRLLAVSSAHPVTDHRDHRIVDEMRRCLRTNSDEQMFMDRATICPAPVVRQFVPRVVHLVSNPHASSTARPSLSSAGGTQRNKNASSCATLPTGNAQSSFNDMVG